MTTTTREVEIQCDAYDLAAAELHHRLAAAESQLLTVLGAVADWNARMSPEVHLSIDALVAAIHEAAADPYSNNEPERPTVWGT